MPWKNVPDSRHLVATCTRLVDGQRVIRGVTQIGPEHEWARNRYPQFVERDSDEGRAAIQEAELGPEPATETTP